MSEPTPEQSPDTEQPMSLFDHIAAQAVPEPPVVETPPPAPKRKTASEKARELISGTPKINTENGQDRGRNTRSRTAKKAAPVPASKPGEFVEPLEQLYSMAGMGMSMFDLRSGHIVVDQDGMHTPCGEVIVENATKIAEAWDLLAQKNPAVRRALRSMITVSAGGALIAAHAPIAIAILQAHVLGQNTPPDHDHEPYAPSEADTEANQNRV